MSDRLDPGFGLYIHWPFCQSKCPYCDFNSHVSLTIDHARYQSAYLQELDRVGAETSGRILQSVFFGGGTPSLMPPGIVDSILAKVRAVWSLSNDIEVTLEANPSSVEAGRFSAFREAGVNRVSVGVQALNDESLRRLGRMHSAQEARLAIEIAQQIFPRVSFDLIYGRQEQSLTEWHEELKQALGLNPTHLSLYQLTIEEGTVFHERAKLGHLRGLPDEDLSADLFHLTQNLCNEAGLFGYEVSNHAVPGQESRHNLTYWLGGDYLGIGPGAHGRITKVGDRFATECPKAPNDWLKSVEQTENGETLRSKLSRHEVATEYLMMGLRLYTGISVDRLETIIGQNLDANVISALQSDSLIGMDGGQLFATKTGMPVLNSIVRKIAQYGWT